MKCPRCREIVDQVVITAIKRPILATILALINEKALVMAEN